MIRMKISLILISKYVIDKINSQIDYWQYKNSEETMFDTCILWAPEDINNFIHFKSSLVLFSYCYGSCHFKAGFAQQQLKSLALTITLPPFVLIVDALLAFPICSSIYKGQHTEMTVRDPWLTLPSAMMNHFLL